MEEASSSSNNTIERSSISSELQNLSVDNTLKSLASNNFCNFEIGASSAAKEASADEESSSNQKQKKVAIEFEEAEGLQNRKFEEKRKIYALPNDILGKIFSLLPYKDVIVDGKTSSKKLLNLLESSQLKAHSPTWIGVMKPFQGRSTSSCIMHDDYLLVKLETSFPDEVFPVGSAEGVLLLQKYMIEADEDAYMLYLRNPLLPSYVEM